MILNTIREKGPISRVDLSVSCSLSIATTKRLIDELISQGLVSEGASHEEHRSRGRKASVLGLNGRFGFAVGVDIEPDALILTGLGFDGSVISRRELHPATDDRGRLQEQLFAEVRGTVDECIARGGGPLMGIGIGIAGLVNSREGVILYCPGLPGWENVGLAALMRERFNVQTLIDDGVRCMALAEKRHGPRRDLDTFLFIYIGHGVGAGIVLDNRMYRGKNGVCGEFGHITVRENGPLCKCGNRGCLEALVSTSAIQNHVRELLSANVYSVLRDRAFPSGSLTLADLYEAAIEGDKLANIVVGETEESIGIGVADLINIFDPGTVILAGDVVENLHELILDGVKRIVRRRALHTIAQRTVIEKSGFETNTAALGAATMVIERFLENEILNL